MEELGHSLQSLYDIFFNPKKVAKEVIPEVDLSGNSKKAREPLFVHVKDSNFHHKEASTRSLKEVEELRQLQQCVHGVSYTSDITEYYCNTTRVTKTEYDSETSIDPSRCSTRIESNQNLCICPRDYYGSQCDL